MKTSSLLIICLGLLIFACNPSRNAENEEQITISSDSIILDIPVIIEETEPKKGSPTIAELQPTLAEKETEQPIKKGITNRGVSRDEGEAKKIYERAEKYEFGDGVKKDIERAVELYRESAEMGFAQAQYSLAFLLSDEKESLKWLTKSAENGYSDAQYELGIQYLYGYGVNPDLKKSIFWFEKSADNGHKIGQYKLGLMYDTGEGVRQNLTKAAKLYKLSADQGVGIAQFNLAMMYITGEGVDTVNMNMAAFWMDKARIAGVKDAKKAWSKFHLDEFN